MEEGDAFMKAAQNVMRHYNVQSTQKTMDWISFAGVGCMIYVPRIVAIANNRKAAKPSATVHPLRAVQTPPATSTATPGPGGSTLSPMQNAYEANMQQGGDEPQF